ncbi:MFS transporter [Marinomonas transparens]|uniref:MFS transporter n=1 Tax=Marinomonas transparens TaxID=2795388 RepID=A0A934N193_9GAMM|nr:MFS transporter [Marinomonas transparens]MBJ7536453.1 MFS transporter [Marinomonas transparens]
MERLKRLTQHDAVYLLLFIFLIALNMRGPVTGFPPLLDRIGQDLQLSSVQSGLLTSLPLLAFAFFAPVASWLTKHFQMEKILTLGVGLIALGMITRSLGFVSTLYLGAILIGAGIAIGNVLLPSLLKREFPNHIVQLTSIYVLMMSLGGFVMASSAVPLSLVPEQAWFPFSISGWSFALATQTLMILLPLMIWLTCKITQHDAQAANSKEASYKLWRSTTAWQVTGFLCVNSLLNYTIVAWMPAILINYGYTDSMAGLYQGYLQIAGALPALILAPFLNRLGSYRRISLISTGLAWLSLLGLLFIPSWSALWAFLFGFGVCMAFILGLSFISLRTQSPKQAAALSGMAQFVSYTLAALGPVLFGALYDWQESWQIPLYVLLVICSFWVVIGWFASPKSDA